MELYSIIWSPVAKLSYLQILEYLEETWTIKEINSFISRTEEVLTYVSGNPKIYIYSEEHSVYKCVVTKQVSLFFRIKIKTVELLVFWDNRRDPATLSF